MHDLRRLMRLVESLHEAPIGDIHIFGGDQPPASLGADDLGIVQSPKGQAKIHRVLQKAPIVINLAFVNHPHPYTDPDDIGNPARKINVKGNEFHASGTFTPMGFEYVYGFDLPADDNALTVAFGFNFGGNNRMPLTPWIIAHRISHAIEEADRKAGEGPISAVLQVFNDMFFRHLPDGVYEQSWLTAQPDDLIYAIGTFKSARDETTNNSGEFIGEMFAQYLIQGRVTFNKIGHEIPKRLAPDTLRKYPKIGRPNPGDAIKIARPDILNELVERFRQTAEKMFLDALRSFVGKIIVL